MTQLEDAKETGDRNYENEKDGDLVGGDGDGDVDGAGDDVDGYDDGDDDVDGDLVGGAHEADDRALVGVLRLAVDDSQVILVMHLLVIRT